MNARRLLSLAGLLLTVFSFAGATARAALPSLSFGDWQVYGSQLFIDFSGNFRTPSHVTVTRPGTVVDADSAFGNFRNRNATLTGHVVMHDNNGIMQSFAAGAAPSRAPSTLTCDELQIAAGTYIATGSVHFSQGSGSVSADRAILHGDTRQLELHGHVHLIE